MTRSAVVILNWNGELLLQEFLPIVVANSDGYDIVVVDNFSSDDSVAFVKREFPYVHILQLDMNYGFAGGYNRALKVLDYEYVILLNSDVAPSSGWINPLVENLDANSNIAVAVPKIRDYKSPNKFEYAGAAGGFVDFLGYPFCRGRIFDYLEDDLGQYDNQIDLFWASGAAFAIRRDKYLELGGFDENFFAHQEEIDLCWRINNLGCVIRYVPQSIVYHLGGATLDSSNPIKTYLNFRNNLLMIIKNYPSKGVALVVLMRFLLDGVAGLKFLLDGKIGDMVAIIKAHFSVYLLIGIYSKKRKSTKPLNKLHTLIYSKSILWQFFAKKKYRFSDLD